MFKFEVFKKFPPFFFGILISLFILSSCKVAQKQSYLQDDGIVNSFPCNSDSCTQCKIPAVAKQNPSTLNNLPDPKQNNLILRLNEPFGYWHKVPSGIDEKQFSSIFDKIPPIDIQVKYGNAADVAKYRYEAYLKIAFRGKTHTLKYELYGMKAPTFVRYLHTLSSLEYFDDKQIISYKGLEHAPLKLEDQEGTFAFPVIGLDDASASIANKDAENILKVGPLQNGESLGCGDLIYPIYSDENGESQITPTRISWYPCSFFKRNRKEPIFYEGTWPKNYFPILLGRLASDPAEFKAHEILLAEIEKELNKPGDSNQELAKVVSFDIIRKCDCCFNTETSQEPWGFVTDRGEMPSSCLYDLKLLRTPEYLGPDKRLYELVNQCPDKDQLFCHYKKASSSELYCRTQKFSDPFVCKVESETDKFIPPLSEAETEIPKGKIPYDCYKKSGFQQLIEGVEKMMEEEKKKQYRDQSIREKYPFKRPTTGPIQ